MEFDAVSALDRLMPFLEMAEGAVLTAAAVFARIGGILFFLPGFGERYTPMRIKLAAAFALAMIVWPITVPQAPPLTPAGGEFYVILLAETAVGLLIGLSVRTLIYALQIAGTIAAQNLSIAQLFNSGLEAAPEPSIATLLTFSGVALAFALGLHVKAAILIVESYSVMPFGVFPLGGDVAAWTSERVAAAFNLAVSLALPFIIIGFIYNLAIGFINRAMPQLMVAFVGMPLITWMGLTLLAVTTVTALGVWHDRFDELLFAPLGVRVE